ncbi:MAG: transposase [Moorea sp. SIO4G3]|nr:transposase [Moorena sp. SIO4G3]
MKGSTITRWGKRRWQIEGFFKTVKYQFGLASFGQKTLLGVYRWLILSLISYLLAYWVYLHLGNSEDLDWYHCSEQALILLFYHIFILSILKQLELLSPWLNERGFEFCFLRCKI